MPPTLTSIFSIPVSATAQPGTLIFPVSGGESGAGDISIDVNCFARRFQPERLPHPELQSALEKLTALVNSEQRPARMDKRLPDAALQDIPRCVLQFANLRFLLRDALSKHFAGGCFVAKRFAEFFQLQTEIFQIVIGQNLISRRSSISSRQ